jgi:hypothetical protein
MLEKGRALIYLTFTQIIKRIFEFRRTGNFIANIFDKVHAEIVNLLYLNSLLKWTN